MAKQLPWFRMWVEARNDAKLNILSDAQFRIWFKLLCYAADSSPTRGQIPDYDPDVLSIEVAGGSIETMQETLRLLARLKIIAPEWESCINFISFESRQYDKPSDFPSEVKQRVAKSRAAKLGVTASADTPCNADVDAINATYRDVTLCNALEESREDKKREENIRDSPQTPQGDLHEPDAVHADTEEVAEPKTTGGKIPPPKHKPAEFKAFYLAYPRHDAPRDAAKAWDQVKPTDEDILAIDAALSQIQDRRFTRESRVRCKQPGAWLRAERWNSEDPFPGLVVFDDEQDKSERARSNSPQSVNFAIPPGMTIDYEATLARAAAERDRVLATVQPHHRRHHARMGN